MTGLDDDVLFSGVAALSRRIRARELSPVALADACLDRLERLGTPLGAVVTVTGERARAEAQAAETEIAAGRWRGPLHGIPYGLVDLLDTAGVRTTGGARPWADRVPERDATLVTRLREAGAVLAGKLALVELAGGLGYHSPGASLTGPCRNPWSPARWAGGSSSGPGAAVAAGLVPFALASDTGGSFACPAAFCGVTAFRPTYGVLSRHGAIAVSYTLDRLGPLARSAQDCALVVAALAGDDPRDPSSVAAPTGIQKVRPDVPKGLRVAALPSARPLPLAGAREAFAGAAGEAFAAALDVFREAGAFVEEATLPELPYAALASLFVSAEAATALEELIRSGRTRELADPSHAAKGPDDYLPRANAADYVRALRVRGEVQRQLARFFERFDLVVAPSLPFAPPRVEERLEGPFAAADPLGAAGSVAGLPGAAVPIGFAGGFPLSMQLAGPPLEDARVLSAAALFQARTRFHLERPPSVDRGPSPAPSAPVARSLGAAVTRR